MDRKKLIRAAFRARRKAYAPYSRFYVGAAILAADGRIFTGCNVENAAYGAGICAERTALVKAVSEGVTEFEAIAVVGGRANMDVRLSTDTEETESAYLVPELPLTSPCGICRQALYEFGGDRLPVLMAQSETNWKEMELGELLPLGFGPGNLA